MEKEKRKYLLNKGNKTEYSHLIIIIDRSDYIPEEIIRYVKRTEDIKDVVFQIITNPNYELFNIFNYDMDLEIQINEIRPYHIIAPYSKKHEAYKFAETKHKGQIRKDGSLYINHPIKVAELISKYFANHPRISELITSAYLHDVVEDTDTSIEEIRQIFGEYVSYLVDGVTSDNHLKKSMGKTNYLCNKLLNMDEDTLNLKLCDRLANVLDLNNADDAFADKYVTETIMILNYLLTNRTVTNTQKDIIRDINKQINKLRKQKIFKLTGNHEC